ncbi:MAG: nucleoside-diphosphate kinase [Bacteroidales bacterium]|nr:nucleoside-diphosphate kinase [Bacteroidales bacterium]
MTGKKTFTMIKPNAVKSGHVGSILHTINAAGFCIKGLKMLKMSPALAKKFYAVHKKRDFFPELIDYICSGPIVAVCIEGDNAVESFRNLIGATDPKTAGPETIRAKYGESMQMNAIHGSDSNENAAKEIELIFGKDELF